jgi:hypothetical protein
MRKHLFSLNVRDTPSDRLKKFANYFLKDGKRYRVERIMRELLIEIKRNDKVKPSNYILSLLSKIYVPVGLRKEKTATNTIVIPIFSKRSTSFYKSIIPLLKAIRNIRQFDKIVDRIYTGLKRLNLPDSEIVERAKELRYEIIKNKGNAYKGKR